MQASLPCPVFWRRLGVAVAGAVALGAVGSADARLWPRVAAFVSVAHAADMDPLAAVDNLRPEERGFLRLGVEAARQQTRLAQLAVAQATGSDVRTFAQQLSSDSRQIADAIAALAAREGVILLPSNNAPNPVYTQLTQVAAADFDRQFVLTVAATTDDLTKIFEQTVADAKDGDVRALAASQLPTLQAHANAIVALRKALE